MIILKISHLLLNSLFSLCLPNVCVGCFGFFLRSFLQTAQSHRISHPYPQILSKNPLAVVVVAALVVEAVVLGLVESPLVVVELVVVSCIRDAGVKEGGYTGGYSGSTRGSGIYGFGW